MKSLHISLNIAHSGRVYFYLHNLFSYNQASAGQAVLKMDGVVMADQPIAVAISNPPPRNAPMTERDHPSFVPSLGGGKKDTRCVLSVCGLMEGNSRMF